MAGNHTSSLSLGDDNANDLNAQDQTLPYNPWFEFQEWTVLFVPEGYPAARKAQLSRMTEIGRTGVNLG